MKWYAFAKRKRARAEASSASHDARDIVYGTVHLADELRMHLTECAAFGRKDVDDADWAELTRLVECYARVVEAADACHNDTWRRSLEKDYHAVRELAMQVLHELNPLVLALAFVHAELLHDIAGDEEEARRLAKQAFDDAVGFNMGRGEDWELTERERRETAHVLQQLRDRLAQWSDAG